MTREKRLGRGLAALLGAPQQRETIDDGDSSPATIPFHQPETNGSNDAIDITTSDEKASEQSLGDGDMFLLNVYEIDDNPFQPRREFNESEIASLSESLKQHDMLQPVLVRRVNDRYQLISGERRLRAAIRAGWTQLPARVRQADDRLVAELAIVENLQRKDLNPIEKALSFRRYLDEHDCPQEELADRLKINRSTIANLMRLLELPEPVRESLGQGLISAGHARALLPLGDEALQIDFCERIHREGISVREIERLVGERIHQEDSQPLTDEGSSERRSTKRTKSDQHASLESELRMALGTKVDIRQTAQGRGRIVIHFGDHDEFQRLRDLLIETGGIEMSREAA